MNWLILSDVTNSEVNVGDKQKSYKAINHYPRLSRASSYFIASGEVLYVTYFKSNSSNVDKSL